MLCPAAPHPGKKFLLSGFGRKPEVADIYKIPVFFINNGEEALAGILGAI